MDEEDRRSDVAAAATAAAAAKSLPRKTPERTAGAQLRH
jgi:hypothetical protein